MDVDEIITRSSICESSSSFFGGWAEGTVFTFNSAKSTINSYSYEDEIEGSFEAPDSSENNASSSSAGAGAKPKKGGVLGRLRHWIDKENGDRFMKFFEEQAHAHGVKRWRGKRVESKAFFAYRHRGGNYYKLNSRYLEHNQCIPEGEEEAEAGVADSGEHGDHHRQPEVEDSGNEAETEEHHHHHHPEELLHEDSRKEAEHDHPEVISHEDPRKEAEAGVAETKAEREEHEKQEVDETGRGLTPGASSEPPLARSFISFKQLVDISRNGLSVKRNKNASPKKPSFSYVHPDVPYQCARFKGTWDRRIPEHRTSPTPSSAFQLKPRLVVENKRLDDSKPELLQGRILKVYGGCVCVVNPNSMQEAMIISDKGTLKVLQSKPDTGDEAHLVLPEKNPVLKLGSGSNQVSPRLSTCGSPESSGVVDSESFTMRKESCERYFESYGNPEALRKVSPGSSSSKEMAHKSNKARFKHRLNSGSNSNYRLLFGKRGVLEPGVRESQAGLRRKMKKRKQLESRPGDDASVLRESMESEVSSLSQFSLAETELIPVKVAEEHDHHHPGNVFKIDSQKLEAPPAGKRCKVPTEDDVPALGACHHQEKFDLEEPSIQALEEKMLKAFETEKIDRLAVFPSARTSPEAPSGWQQEMELASIREPSFEAVQEFQDVKKPVELGSVQEPEFEALQPVEKTQARKPKFEAVQPAQKSQGVQAVELTSVRESNTQKIQDVQQTRELVSVPDPKKFTAMQPAEKTQGAVEMTFTGVQGVKQTLELASVQQPNFTALHPAHKSPGVQQVTPAPVREPDLQPVNTVHKTQKLVLVDLESSRIHLMPEEMFPELKYSSAPPERDPGEVPRIKSKGMKATMFLAEKPDDPEEKMPLLGNSGQKPAGNAGGHKLPGQHAWIRFTDENPFTPTGVDDRRGDRRTGLDDRRSFQQAGLDQMRSSQRTSHGYSSGSNEESYNQYPERCYSAPAQPQPEAENVFLEQFLKFPEYQHEHQHQHQNQNQNQRSFLGYHGDKNSYCPVSPPYHPRPPRRDAPFHQHPGYQSSEPVYPLPPPASDPSLYQSHCFPKYSSPRYPVPPYQHLVQDPWGSQEHHTPVGYPVQSLHSSRQPGRRGEYHYSELIRPPPQPQPQPQPLVRHPVPPDRPAVNPVFEPKPVGKTPGPSSLHWLTDEEAEIILRIRDTVGQTKPGQEPEDSGRRQSVFAEALLQGLQSLQGSRPSVQSLSLTQGLGRAMKACELPPETRSKPEKPVDVEKGGSYAKQFRKRLALLEASCSHEKAGAPSETNNKPEKKPEANLQAQLTNMKLKSVATKIQRAWRAHHKRHTSQVDEKNILKFKQNRAAKLVQNAWRAHTKQQSILLPRSVFGLYNMIKKRKQSKGLSIPSYERFQKLICRVRAATEGARVRRRLTSRRLQGMVKEIKEIALFLVEASKDGTSPRLLSQLSNQLEQKRVQLDTALNCPGMAAKFLLKRCPATPILPNA